MNKYEFQIFNSRTQVDFGDRRYATRTIDLDIPIGVFSKGNSVMFDDGITIEIFMVTVDIANSKIIVSGYTK